MKKALKIGLEIASILVLTAGMVSSLILSHEKDYKLACSDISVDIPGKHEFLDKDDVMKLLKNNYGVIIGERLNKIDLFKIETIVKTRSSVKECEAWVTKDCILHIQIIQREPVLKIQDKKGNGYYSDKDGIVFPLSDKYEAEVPIIRCNTAKGMDREWLNDALDFVQMISSSPKWNSIIKAYIVADNDDFILLSDEEKIIFGDFSDFKEKMNKLDRFYTQIKPVKSEYKIVNLKYKGQIVCRKKDM